MVAAELSKIVMVTINVIFLLFGLASLIVGIIFKVGWDDVRDAFEDNAAKADINLQAAGDTLAYGAIILGSIIIVIALLGCVGACCQVKVLLAIYAIIILLLLIGEIVVVALVVTKGDDAEDAISDVLKDTLKNYHEDSDNGKSKAFSALFSTMECCGITNYSSDFQGFLPSTSRDQTKYPIVIPITCCHGVDYENKLTAKIFDDHAACLKTPTSSNAYVKGCQSLVVDFITDHKAIVIGVGVAILVLEVIMIVMAFFLCCRNED